MRKRAVPSGVAEIDEELLAIRLTVEPWAGSGGTPFATFGSGLHGIGVRGEANQGFSGFDGRTWSGAGLIGLGYRHELGGSLSLHVEADAVSILTPTTVEFDGEEGAALRNPRWFGLVGLRMSI